MTEEQIFAGRRSALQWLEGHEGTAMHAGTVD
jgi:hypothetical protein